MNDEITPRETANMAETIRMMLTAVGKSTDFSERAFNLATETKRELIEFRNSAQEVLDRENRIDSNQIRLIRRVVEARIRMTISEMVPVDPALTKRKMFSRCYHAIHDACLVSTITDIPQKLYDHALHAAKTWQPDEMTH